MNYLRYLNQELYFGIAAGKTLSAWTKNYLGPVYIYDLGILRERFLQMQKALPQVEIYYAMKANSHPEILKALALAGAGVDVVSLGEAERALENGFLAKNIVFSGVGKTRHELRRALELGIAQINVESVPELERIASIAKKIDKIASVALRLNPDVDIQTHPYIATGLKDNKFGMELSLLPEIIQILRENKSVIQLQGISLHLGSQMNEFSGFAEALEKLIPVYHNLKSEFPTVEVFDFGGGLGIFYEQQDLATEQALLQEYARIALKLLSPLRARLQSEPGRWLVAHAGVLLTQVQYVKKTTHKTFVIVDAGMNHLLRPSLYEAYHEIWSIKEIQEKATVDVVGPICESGDFFAKDRLVSRVEQDDFLILADVGAYGFSMANTYNLQTLPREIVL